MLSFLVQHYKTGRISLKKENMSQSLCNSLDKIYGRNLCIMSSISVTSLNSFQVSEHYKRIGKEFVLWVDTQTEEQITDYKRAFANYDKHCDGTIPLKDLGKLMRSLGKNPTENELSDLTNEFISNGHIRSIAFPEFVAMMARFQKDSHDDIYAAFKVFDQDGNGTIETKELKETMLSLFEGNVSEHDIDLVMEWADANGDGHISYEEFVALFTTANS